MQQIDGEVLVNNRTRNTDIVGGKRRRAERERNNGERGEMHECSAAHGIASPMTSPAICQRRWLLWSGRGGAVADFGFHRGGRPAAARLPLCGCLPYKQTRRGGRLCRGCNRVHLANGEDGLRPQWT